MKKILIVANSDAGLYCFRNELLIELSAQYTVGVAVPFGKYISEIQKNVDACFDYSLERRGVNFLNEIKLIETYAKIIDAFKPDVVLTYTIKPNLYGGYVCARRGIPCLCNITGLGSAFNSKGVLKNLLLFMYRVAMRKANTIFIQNRSILQYFREQRIGKEEQYYLLPGSGVNLDHFHATEYPRRDVDRFLFAARIMKEKGIDEFLEVARRFRQEGRNAEFLICGNCEDESYKKLLDELTQAGVVAYAGAVKDMIAAYNEASCVVLPTYHEGMANVLLEGAATERPVLASRIPGCQETFDEGVSGYGFEPRDADDLYRVLERFTRLSHKQKAEMGRKGREKMEREFDRRIVIDAYLEKIVGALNVEKK